MHALRNCLVILAALGVIVTQVQAEDVFRSELRAPILFTGTNGGGGEEQPTILAPAISFPASHSLLRDHPYASSAPVVTNGQIVSGWTATPALPLGLGIDPATGVLSGTPLVHGGYGPFTLTATNAAGHGTASFSLLIELPVVAPTIAFDTTHALTKNQEYASTAPAVTNEQPVSSWSVSPALPAGLSVDEDTGILSGTPTTSGTFGPFTLTAINEAGQGTATFSIDIASVADAFAWGYNPNDILRIGGVGTYSSPTAIADLTDYTSFAMGNQTACGIRADGIWCWGAGNVGQLGNGANANSTTPVKVVGSEGMTGLVAGSSHFCAIASGGVRCWGYGADGQLGNGANANSNVPVQVSNISSAVQLSAEGDVTCAIDSAGAKCWGNGTIGKLGTGNSTNRNTATAVSSGTAFTRVVVGVNHTCGLKGDVAWCWGMATHGALGNGVTTGTYTSPQAVSSGTGFSELALTNGNTCGVKSGSVYCWGRNDAKQSSTGAASSISAPTLYTGSSGVTAIDGGSLHICGLRGGQAVCWGSNSSGNLGVGNTTAQTGMVDVSNGAFSKIFVGGSHAVGIR